MSQGILNRIQQFDDEFNFVNLSQKYSKFIFSKKDKE